jgi:hypothetical protein
LEASSNVLSPSPKSTTTTSPCCSSELIGTNTPTSSCNTSVRDGGCVSMPGRAV